jgi:exodeoxyribonuclease V gamma subunit
VLRAVTYSRVAPKHRLAAWVRLLALTAAQPERHFTAATIGRAGGNATATIAQVTGPGGDAAERREWALGHLAALVDLYDRGMREPLPVYCATSAAYAEASAAGRDPETAAREAWTTEWKITGEDEELEHQLVLGGVLAFDDLLADAPRTDEGWEPSEATRFGRYARRMWDGVLASEELTSR